MAVQTQCPQCGGSGKMATSFTLMWPPHMNRPASWGPCSRCAGTGFVSIGAVYGRRR